MRAVPPTLTRRGVQGLLAGAALLPLAGCDLDDLRPDPAPATPTPPSADERLVDEVVAALTAARAVATAAGADALATAHGAHLAVLRPAPGGSDSTSPSASPSATTAPAPGGDLRGTEQRLEQTLTDAADRAEEGGLARLLASMAASVAQHLVTLSARAAS